eukprot:304066_1
MPKLLLNKEINEEINGIDIEICDWKENEKENRNQNKNKNLNPNPIKIELPEINNVNNIIKWFEYISPIIMKHSKLYNNISKKQIIAIFICNDCIHNTHKCFICNDNKIIPQKCVMNTCGKYYHKQCLINNINYKLHTEFYLNGKIKCPKHKCWNCNENKLIKRKFCWYCPRNYHRNCVPINAELISVQITDNINKIQQYPDFRYDLISCGSDNYNCKKGKDLQFGRNDIKYGLFKLKLWNNDDLQFYKLNDDPFSIDYNMLSDYKLRKKLKKNKKKYNIWPKNNFRKIKKNKGIICNRGINSINIGRCSCINGCLLNNSCYNYSMDIECTNKNCGSLNTFLCENRQFTNLNKNILKIKIKKTKNNCGMGAYAKNDLIENELIIEYVGE